jgi:5'-3' exonuclease
MGVPGFYRTIFKRYLKSKHKIYKMVKSHNRDNSDNANQTESVISIDNTNVMYFYIDFNPIIYLSLIYVTKSRTFNSVDELEEALIENIIATTQEIVNDFVRPKKLLFIAIDGPAPKCKLVTQRARRYKSIYEQTIKANLRKKYGQQTNASLDWDRANITPGTAFMEKLDSALRACISSRGFNCPNIIFSDSTMVSEGEHKITKHLSGLTHSVDEEICVYSNDGDMAFLAMQFPEKNIVTMIDSGFLPKNVQKKCETPYVYFVNKAFHKVFINDLMSDHQGPVKRSREVFVNENLQVEGSDKSNNTTENNNVEIETEDENNEFDNDIVCPWDVNRILMDFLCVSFLGGNDFVRALPFSEIRKSGSYMMYLKAYKKAKTRNDKSYLVTIKTLQNNKKKVILNPSFLYDVLFNISRQECRKMKDYQTYIKQELNKAPSWGPFTNWEEEWLEYQHSMYCISGHPEHEFVREELSSYDKYVLVPQKEIIPIISTSNTVTNTVTNNPEAVSSQNLSPLILSDGNTAPSIILEANSIGQTTTKQNYDIVNNSMNEWKAQYYKKNFGFDSNDKKNYNFDKLKLCRTYIKSLMFTLQYYINSSPPSWRWNYQHHVAPWPSDLLIAIRNSDFEVLDNFSISYPYTPLEQLLLTVPITSKAFPQEYKCNTIKQMLPNTDNISIDRINGDKYIYAEPILSDIDEYKLLDYSRKIKLNPENKKRNQVGTNFYIKSH